MSHAREAKGGKKNRADCAYMGCSTPETDYVRLIRCAGSSSRPRLCNLWATALFPSGESRLSDIHCCHKLPGHFLKITEPHDFSIH